MFKEDVRWNGWNKEDQKACAEDEVAAVYQTRTIKEQMAIPFGCCEHTLRYCSLALHYQAVLSFAGSCDLGKRPSSVVGRRRYLLQMIQSKKKSFTSDDRRNFNESHSLRDMRQLVQAFADKYSKRCSLEVANDIQRISKMYIKEIEEKAILVDGVEYVTPSTLFSGDPLTQIFNTFFN